MTINFFFATYVTSYKLTIVTEIQGKTYPLTQIG